MNILIYSTKSSYSSSKVGGAETSLRLIAEQLASRGHSVIYAAHARQAAVTDSLINGVRVVLLPRFSRGVLHRFFGMRQLKKQLDLSRIDLVHVYYQLRPMQFFLRKRERYGYAVVVRMAGLYWLDAPENSSTRVRQYSRAFAQADGMNYISHGIRDLCRSRAHSAGILWDDNYPFVLDIGVPALHEAYQWQPQKQSGKMFHAVTATRFSSVQKRQDILVQAIAVLRDNHQITEDSFHLTLIGEGEKRTAIELLIRELELENYCTVISFLPQQQLWEAMQTADVLCHPCEYEGLSKIIIESMMMGLPVCASNVVPLSDYIVHGENGFLSNNDSHAWANVLQHVMSHRYELPGISAAAQRYAKLEYCPDIQAEKYERHFRHFIDARSDEGDI